ncbi:unnamed protein product, partial [Rotaria sordida]
FRSSLDLKSDHTRTESIYKQFNNHEIMFHVSTLLPHSKIGRQQLERKRHIDNDIVAIVFQENQAIFNPECIASQFLHVYLVITPIYTDGTAFRRFNAFDFCSLARDNRFKSIEMYTEVIQDSIFDLIDSDKLRFASTTALTFSSEGQKRFHRDLYELKS